MKTEILKRIPMLSDIDTELLENNILKHSIYTKNYSKSETVYNKSDLCVSLDIVLKGSLVAYSFSENGSTKTMFEFRKNSILGANLLFSENNAYPLSIYCMTDCQLLHINQKTVLELLHNYNFVINYIKSLSLNSQGMNQKIALFTQRSLRQNILDYFNQQSIIQKSSTITLPISKKELADYFCVQRPSLFRELKKLKDENIIDIDNRKIILKKF